MRKGQDCVYDKRSIPEVICHTDILQGQTKSFAWNGQSGDVQQWTIP